MTIAQLIENVPISKLISTDTSPFWYLHTYTGNRMNGKYRYHHETGKVGDRFRDGNNGDLWEVKAITTKNNRAFVRNLSQKYSLLVFWG